MAEGVVSFYAALEEHPDEPQHPRVRGAVRRLERLKDMDRITPGRGSASEEAGRTEDLEASQSAPRHRWVPGPRQALWSRQKAVQRVPGTGDGSVAEGRPRDDRDTAQDL